VQIGLDDDRGPPDVQRPGHGADGPGGDGAKEVGLRRAAAASICTPSERANGIESISCAAMSPVIPVSPSGSAVPGSHDPGFTA